MCTSASHPLQKRDAKYKYTANNKRLALPLGLCVIINGVFINALPDVQVMDAAILFY